MYIGKQEEMIIINYATFWKDIGFSLNVFWTSASIKRDSLTFLLSKL